jgi:hypothetical protein
MTPLFAFGFFEIGIGALIVVGLIAVFNFRALKRLFSAGSVQVGKIGRWASEKDPLAVYQERIDEGTEKIAKGRQFLGQAGGEVRSAKRSVTELQTEAVRLNNRIDTAEKAGDPNHTLEGYALELADVEEKLGHGPQGGWNFDGKECKFVQTQESQWSTEDQGTGALGRLFRAQLRFDNFSAQILQGQEQIETARKEARDLGMELQQSQHEKEMNEFANSFDPSSFGSDDTLKAARDKLKQQIDDNRGSGDANAALNVKASSRAKDAQLERSARAQEILARRKKPAEA